MRDYSIVSGRFWIGETGKSLRSDADSQRLAFYLITSPHSSMSGLYYCPILYMAQDIGMPPEGATKALRRLCEMGFCEYDEHAEIVFVVKMAKFQIGTRLAPRDNRRSGLMRDLAKLPKTTLLRRFFQEYADAYSITKQDIDLISPYLPEAPPKPLPSQDQDQDQDQEQEQEKSEGSRRVAPLSPAEFSLQGDPGDPTEPPPGASPRLVSIYEAMQSATFLVPGKGEQTLWQNAKRPAQLAKKLHETCPGVDVAALIRRLAGWTFANQAKAKHDLARFVWNAAVKDQDKPRQPAAETYRHGDDLADKIRRGRGER